MLTRIRQILFLLLAILQHANTHTFKQSDKLCQHYNTHLQHASWYGFNTHPSAINNAVMNKYFTTTFMPKKLPKTDIPGQKCNLSIYEQS